MLTFFGNTVIGTNSYKDKLILCQNVEINSIEYFSIDLFSGVKSSTTWNLTSLRNHQENVMSLNMINYGLSNDHQWNFSFNHYWSCYFYFLRKTFRHNGNAVFGKTCHGSPDVNTPRGFKTTSVGLLCRIKSFVQAQWHK